MKEIMAIVRPEKWSATERAAARAGAEFAVRRRVLGRGRQRGLRYLRRVSPQGEGDMLFLPKYLVTCVAPDERADAVVNAIVAANQTGNYGDGKVFVRSLALIETAGEEAVAAAAAGA